MIEPPKPNVIVLLSDDQGYGDLSCHGNPYVKTPNLDRLYRESIRFTELDLMKSVFLPSRAVWKYTATSSYPKETETTYGIALNPLDLASCCECSHIIDAIPCPRASAPTT